MNEPYQHTIFIVAMVVAIVAGWLDWRKGEIPNWLTLGALAIAPVLHVARSAMAKQPMETAVQEGAISLGGAALCAIVPLMLYRQSALGGGDVKLFIALGALLMPMVGIEAQLYSFFAGAIMAPARLAYEGKLFKTLKNAALIGANLFLPPKKQRPIDATVLSWFRLGPAIALGVILACYLHWK